MALLDTLRNLFSRNIIITRQAGNRLKVVDINMTQSGGVKTASNYDKYKWSNKNWAQISGWSPTGTNAISLENVRRISYDDFDIMDKESIVSSALDIYADETVVRNMDNTIISIKTDNDEIQKILYNLFYDVLNIEFNLWYWVRSAVKYGDFFLYLNIKEGAGVVNVIPIHPAMVERQEGFDPDNPMVPKFKYNGEAGGIIARNELEEFEIAHFRMLTDPNMLPYGRSILEGARNEFKKLTLLEDAMMLSRIMRAPERRVFKVDIGNIHPKEVNGYMRDFIASVKKVPYMDETTGQYNLRFNIMTMMEDYYFPVRGGESGTEVDTLPGLQNESQIQDIEYTKTKLIAALKIPKPWLGFDEHQESKANLAALDIRFGKTIERIQKIIVSELYKIALVHLVCNDFKDEDLLNFELTFSNPSIIYKRQQIDMLNEKMNLVNGMLDKNMFSRKYIYEQIFDMSDDEWKRMQKDIIEDKKEDFRMEQITTEGNDPAVTGKSYGTPYDLVAMQTTSGQSDKVKHLYTVDGREENEGQPEKMGTIGTDRDKAFGRDPVGNKSMNASANPSLEGFINRIMDKQLSIQKTLLTEENDDSEIEMLKESNIMRPLDSSKHS